jgi:4-hydroxy-tetrahydrodipicolinate reductase
MRRARRIFSFSNEVRRPGVLPAAAFARICRVLSFRTLVAMKIAIAGASGRMGRMLIETVLNDSDATLSGALDRAGSAQLGQDAGAFLGKQTGVLLTDEIERVFAESDYLIDFTRPEGTLMHLEAAQRHDVKMVIGTTGFDSEQKAQLRAAADKIAIMLSSNMSVGVNVTLKLLEYAAKHFATGYDIEIIEAHHRHKVDAPSGTALTMGEVIANALGRNLDDCAVYSREGVTGERDPSTIGFSAIRGGDIVGDHTVLFAGIGERIEITHKSASRLSYAQGALRAVRFLEGRQTGLFDMQDVLGLR